MNKFSTLIRTGKKKAITLALVGALAITLGGGAAVTANAAGIQLEDVTSFFTWESDENANLSVRDEDGVRSYSTDGGNTWSETAPEGLVVSEVADASVCVQDGGISSISVNMGENEVPQYSIDGGATWSTELPEGMSITVEENGNSITMESIGE